MLQVSFQATLKAKLQFMHGHNQCNMQVTGHGLLTKVVTFVHNVWSCMIGTSRLCFNLF